MSSLQDGLSTRTHLNVRVRPSHEKLFDDTDMTPFRSGVESRAPPGRRAARRRSIDFSTTLEKDPNDLEVSRPRSPLEGSEPRPLGRRGVDVRAPPEEKSHQPDVAVEGRTLQGRYATTGRGGSVDVGPEV